MARMHSDGRGKSGSTKPKNPSSDWIDYQENEVTQLVEKIGKNGAHPSDIGRNLRDQYGIPSVKLIADKSITKLLKEKEMETEIPEDLRNLLKKALRIKKHLKDQPKDQDAERRLNLTEAVIRKLAKYYKANNKIDQGWKYRRDNLNEIL